MKNNRMHKKYGLLHHIVKTLKRLMDTPHPVTTKHHRLPSGNTLAYRLQRRTRRTIGLRIDPHGLLVSAPSSASIQEIETVLSSHQLWIQRQLTITHHRLAHQTEWRHGLQLPRRENTITLRLDPQEKTIITNNDSIILPLPLDASPTAIRVILKSWSTRRVLAWSNELLTPWSGLLETTIPTISVFDAKTRWGSCSSTGKIRLHWKLALLEKPLFEYVLAHEMAHLREMNHSPYFWQHVSTLCPDWKMKRQTLRQHVWQLPD